MTNIPRPGRALEDRAILNSLVRPRGLVILVALAVSSCTKEIGPTVPVTAGAGKSQAAFEVDRRGCMAMTDRALQPVANQMNAAALPAMVTISG